MTNTPYIIGIGPGQSDYIYPLAAQLIAQAEVLIGGRRNLAELAQPGQETLVIDRGLAAVAEYIGQNWQSRRLVVLASGDTSLFSVRAYAAGAVYCAAGHKFAAIFVGAARPEPE